MDGRVVCKCVNRFDPLGWGLGCARMRMWGSSLAGRLWRGLAGRAWCLGCLLGENGLVNGRFLPRWAQYRHPRPPRVPKPRDPRPIVEAAGLHPLQHGQRPQDNGRIEHGDLDRRRQGGGLRDVLYAELAKKCLESNPGATGPMACAPEPVRRNRHPGLSTRVPRTIGRGCVQQLVGPILSKQKIGARRWTSFQFAPSSSIAIHPTPPRSNNADPPFSPPPHTHRGTHTTLSAQQPPCVVDGVHPPGSVRGGRGGGELAGAGGRAPAQRTDPRGRSDGG